MGKIRAPEEPKHPTIVYLKEGQNGELKGNLMKLTRFSEELMTPRHAHEIVQ